MSAIGPKRTYCKCPLSEAKRISKKCRRAGQYPETEFHSAVRHLIRERKLPQRNHQPVEVGGDDQSRLATRQPQHRAVLVGQHDRACAGADRDARAGRAIDPINIRWPSDVADRTDKIGR